MKHLLFDTSNVLFRVASAHGKYNTEGSSEDRAGLAMHIALNTLKMHFNRIKPDRVAMVFEGAKNWRKDYTRSEQCVSKRVYKANRVKDESLAPFYELMASFEQLAREHTTLTCVTRACLEGDDSFGGYAQRYCGLGDEVYGVSGDRDFVQLLKLPNFHLINPDKMGPSRAVDKKGVPIDPEYFMYEKCFRGDPGDNVLPAYPRVRATRLAKSLVDDYERANLMNETWKFNDPGTGKETTFRVGDLYEENRILMDLERQPDWVRAEIEIALDEAEASRGSFNFFKFQQFLGRHKLKKISEDATSFVPLLSGAQTGQASAPAVPAKKSPLVF